MTPREQCEGTQHTPGPWRCLLYGSVDDFGTATRIDVTDTSRIEQPHYCTPVAVCRRVASEGMFSFNPPNAEANARLIAAAPELLAACKWALSDHNPKLANLGTSCGCDRCESLRRVIAKAEGR